MRLAVMQPYLFPYLGYFQLINAVDAFVIYDDVNYIKGGWINRNFICANGSKQLFTLPLRGSSPNKFINQISIGERRNKILQTIRQSYSKAPMFDSVFELVERVFLQKENNLARFLEFGIKQVCQYLNLHPKWYISSSLNKDNALRGQDKVMAICEELGANHYINLPGGKLLYDKDKFSNRGIDLSFIKSRPITYRQFGDTFIPDLSIIDILMFNNNKQCAEFLEECDFV